MERRAAVVHQDHEHHPVADGERHGRKKNPDDPEIEFLALGSFTPNKRQANATDNTTESSSTMSSEPQVKVSRANGKWEVET